MRSTSVEVAYNGVYGDRLGVDIEQSYVPEEFYAGGNARNTAQQTLLQGNVTNPFHISNFESLRATNPALYQRLAGNAFFTSTTISGSSSFGTSRNMATRGPRRASSMATCRSERTRHTRSK